MRGENCVVTDLRFGAQTQRHQNVLPPCCWIPSTRRFGLYFIEPIIAGFDSNAILFWSVAQTIQTISLWPERAQSNCNDCVKQCSDQTWIPGIELFKCISKSMVNAFDRDAGLGWGANVYIIEKDKFTKIERNGETTAYNLFGSANLWRNQIKSILHWKSINRNTLLQFSFFRFIWCISIFSSFLFITYFKTRSWIKSNA